MKIIESGWENYRLKVVPATASRVQLDETQKAFYAGAAHLFAAIMDALDPEDAPTAADMRMMDGVVDEIEAFSLSLGVSAKN